MKKIVLIFLFLINNLYSYTYTEFDLKKDILLDKLYFKKGQMISKYNIINNLSNNEDGVEFIKKIILEEKLYSEYTKLYSELIINQDDIDNILTEERALKSKMLVIINNSIMCLESSKQLQKIDGCENSLKKYINKFYHLNGDYDLIIKERLAALKYEQHSLESKFFLHNSESLGNSDEKNLKNDLLKNAKENKDGNKNYLEKKWANEEKDRLFSPAYIKEVQQP